METLRFINNSSTNVNYKLQILNGSKKDEIMIFPKPGLQGEPYIFFLSRGIHQIEFGQILFRHFIGQFLFVFGKLRTYRGS